MRYLILCLLLTGCSHCHYQDQIILRSPTQAEQHAQHLQNQANMKIRDFEIKFPETRIDKPFSVKVIEE